MPRIPKDRGFHEVLQAARKDERGEEWCRPPGALPPYDPEDPFANMEHSTDDYGREIFVEHRTGDGRPAVWYQYNSAGILQKKTRNANGIQIEKANTNLFGKRAVSVRRRMTD